MPKKIKASDLIQMLRERMASRKGDWIFLTEVRNSTGYVRIERYADAVAMNLWPSSGSEIHGFEVKVSRSDLVHELTTPEKSKAIQEYCDRWWLVLSSTTLIKDGELPAEWGLLTPWGEKLSVRKAAPRLTPKEMDRTFLASLLRSANRQAPAAAQVEGAKKEAREAAGREAESRQRWQKKRLEELEETLAKWGKIVGEEFPTRWGIEDLAARVKLAKSADPGAITERIEELRDSLTSALDTWRKGLQ